MDDSFSVRTDDLASDISTETGGYKRIKCPRCNYYTRGELSRHYQTLACINSVQLIEARKTIASLNISIHLLNSTKI